MIDADNNPGHDTSAFNSAEASRVSELFEETIRPVAPPPSGAPDTLNNRGLATLPITENDPPTVSVADVSLDCQPLG